MLKTITTNTKKKSKKRLEMDIAAYHLKKRKKKIDYSKDYYLNLPKDKKKEIIEKIKVKYHSMNDEQMQKHK